MSSEFFESLNIIEEEKGISRDVVLDALESALISAYKKHFGTVQDIGVVVDEESGEIKIIARKVVAEEVENMTAFHIVRINVIVKGLKPAEKPKKKAK